MLSTEKQYTFEGYNLFRDLNDPYKFYYLPSEKARIAGDGSQLNYIFFRDMSIKDENVDVDNRMGGFLQMEVDLGPYEDELIKIRTALNKYVSNYSEEEMVGATDKTLKLTPVPFKDGDVRLVILGSEGNDKDIKLSIAGSTKPSLFGSQTAVFSVRLGSTEAQIIKSALENKAVEAKGDDLKETNAPLTTAVVMYDLSFLGVMPAHYLKIKVDYGAVDEYSQHVFNADVDFDYKKKDSAAGKNTSVKVVASADVDVLFRDLVESGAIEITNIDYTGEDKGGPLPADDPTAMKLVTQLMSAEFFDMAPLPVEITGGKSKEKESGSDINKAIDGVKDTFDQVSDGKKETKKTDSETASETDKGKASSTPAGAETDKGKASSTPAGAETDKGKASSTPAGAETDKDKASSTPAGAETDRGKASSTPAGTETGKDTVSADKNNTEFKKVNIGCDILFETNKYNIDPDAQAAIIKLAEEKKDKAEIKFKVIGHTDDTGTEKINKDLSMKRAEAVVELLKGNGIAEDRIEKEGKAYEEPVEKATTETARAKNRRTEILSNEQPAQTQQSAPAKNTEDENKDEGSGSKTAIGNEKANLSSVDITANVNIGYTYKKRKLSEKKVVTYVFNKQMAQLHAYHPSGMLIPGDSFNPDKQIVSVDLNVGDALEIPLTFYSKFPWDKYHINMITIDLDLGDGKSKDNFCLTKESPSHSVKFFSKDFGPNTGMKYTVGFIFSDEQYLVDVKNDGSNKHEFTLDSTSIVIDESHFKDIVPLEISASTLKIGAEGLDRTDVVFTKDDENNKEVEILRVPVNPDMEPQVYLVNSETAKIMKTKYYYQFNKEKASPVYQTMPCSQAAFTVANPKSESKTIDVGDPIGLVTISLALGPEAFIINDDLLVVRIILEKDGKESMINLTKARPEYVYVVDSDEPVTIKSVVAIKKSNTEGEKYTVPVPALTRDMSYLVLDIF